MEPKTFFILLAIGMVGLTWAFIRQTKWYRTVDILTAVGFTPFTECLSCNRRIRYGDRCCNHSIQVIPDGYDENYNRVN